MTLTRNEIAAFVVAAILLHLAGFYWIFHGEPQTTGAMAPGSGGLMIDLAGQAGTGGAPKGNTSEPTSEPVEKTAPPEPKSEPEPESKPEPKPEPVAKSVPKPEPAPTRQPKPTPKRKAKPEPQKRMETKPAPPQENAETQGRPDGVAETSQDTAGGKPGLAAQGKAGTGATAGGGTPGARADYRALIIGRLAREKRYPLRARMRGIQGAGLLRLVISPEGAVLSAKLEKSTGSSLLDKEIDRMVEHASPFPAFPENMVPKPLTLRIPVDFELH
ncbi:energy transducer TonB [Parvibaculum sp.]|uniref:energy transducer TonB n=1 Tax=Parvibaculum sp. TaxID=2024848 RepID=UPI000C8BCFDE|nr:energy transducer TonB [Parvibaculum sp.]MAB12981.1 hypothetical protein [Parvibaculum sp.]